MANGYSLFESSFTHLQWENIAESERAGFLKGIQCHFRTPYRSLALGCLYIFGCSAGINGGWWWSSFDMRPHTSRWTPCGRLTGSMKVLSLYLIFVHFNKLSNIKLKKNVCTFLEDFELFNSNMSRTSLLVIFIF